MWAFFILCVQGYRINGNMFTLSKGWWQNCLFEHTFENNSAFSTLLFNLNESPTKVQKTTCTTCSMVLLLSVLTHSQLTNKFPWWRQQWMRLVMVEVNKSLEARHHQEVVKIICIEDLWSYSFDLEKCSLQIIWGLKATTLRFWCVAACLSPSIIYFVMALPPDEFILSLSVLRGHLFTSIFNMCRND